MKNKTLILLMLIFLFIAGVSFSFWHEEYKIEIDFTSSDYSYLPESAKEFIRGEISKGKKVLTEKNKKPGELYLNPIYVDYLTMSEAEQNNVQIVPEIYTWDNNVKTKTSSLSSKYSLVEENYSSKVKNQSTLGICWAFATYSAIESNILISGLSDSEVNFAERQLDYAMSNELVEIDNPYALEGYELGGASNFTFATSYLNYGITPVEENIWGTFDTSLNKRSLKDVLDIANVNYQVTDYVMYGTPSATATVLENESYRTILKEHIKNHGSLYVATLPPSKAETGTCYDEELNLILDDGTCYNPSVGYHALAIVGWDDNYAGGAWILKNSWGEYNTPYTYLAYNSLYYDVSGVTGVKAKNWDNIYDYTKFSTAATEQNSYTITYEKAANFDEYLERISFTHSATNGVYKVYLKTGLTYKLIDVVETTYPGLSTIEVGNILLDKETFTIKIVAEKGTLGNEINAFTSNTSNDVYLEDFKFDQSTKFLEEQLITRNLETGTQLSYYIYDIYGNNYALSNNLYNVNGTVNINQNVNLESGEYYLTLDENFYQVNLSDKIIELDLNNQKEAQLSFSSNDLLKINSITYISENTQIATIDSNGTIVAKGIGKTKVKLIINNVIERICEVIVGPIGEIENIEIIASESIIYRTIDNKLQLNIETYPGGLNSDNVKWETSDSTLATVDETGLVTAISDGAVTITATINGISDSIDIVIKNPKTSITLNTLEKTLNVNETFQMIATYPSEIHHPRIKWISTNEKVATINEFGLITAVSNGITNIRLSVNDDEYMSQALIYVLDSNVYIDLEIDANGGTYKSNSIYKYQENSFKVIELENPIYETQVTLIYNQDLMENKTFSIDHEFTGWTHNGDGILADNTYKIGFENSKLTANWKFNSVILPDLSDIDSKKIFVGWYSDQEFTNYVGKNIEYIPSKDITLYAYWAEYKTADVNSDLVVDITDLVILRKHLAEITTLANTNALAADINHDGIVDITDLIILRKYLAGLEEIE